MTSTAVDMQVDEGTARHTPIEVDSPSPPPVQLPPKSSNPSPVPETNVLQTRRKAKVPSSVTASAADPASAGANKPLTTTTLSTKPKSGKPASTAPINGHKPNSASPSPPPPPRPALQTVRLEIKLGGPEDYEVDIAQLSKETGQRPPTPPRAGSPHPDESSESEVEPSKDDAKPKKKRKRKNAAQEYYDVTDPFIDDSELAVDERTFFAQTKQQGFYVSSGQVALLTDKPAPKKSKGRASKKLNILPPAASITAALSSAQLPSLAPLSTSSSKLNAGDKPPVPKAVVPTIDTGSLSAPSSARVPKSEPSEGFLTGTKDSPIRLDADDVPQPASPHTEKRKVSESMHDEGFPISLSVGADIDTKKRKRAVPIRPFHPDLEPALDELKAAIAQEDWSVKGKFPPGLKPLLAQVALKAIVLGDYDENFFNLMPKIFPYNRFTMTKLIKRTVWRDHTNLLVERQNVLLEDLKKLAEEGFPKAADEWERSVLMWERRQNVRTDGQDGQGHPQPHSSEGTPIPSSTHPTPTFTTMVLQPDKSADDSADMDVDDAHLSVPSANGKTSQNAKDVHPPQKRYKLTDTMKGIIWQLVCLSNECCRIENEKNVLENNHQVVSDQGVRKTLYQKIVACFPDGWLSSGQISREVSVMKKKYEKELENESET
ncbi:uncharacterized protein PHACADRAFT_125998 [Phanerochaete carnosa HHB-10118-sp]|uniref:Ubinuclein middle domain-containing protein n=1 Tax=Phanerochaete carnosa (strain HHB-10118-sp) TaxID=650164 RepID=K5W0B7_PHACS|nr:uncharacterized protein PHACADRAFT_125998 [Phanerochaete carnosa HHB-10118-sp]EKM52289.1 hypothetical protein PHACADRAFT_125998 [Phanerochaete carnosa HHB-10118-sp]